jgi:hypothetical protein
LKIGVARVWSVAGEWVAVDKTELEAIEGAVGTRGSKKVLIDND